MLYFAWRMGVKTQTCLRVPSQNSLGTVPRPSACSFLTHHLCIQIYLLAHKLIYIKFFSIAYTMSVMYRFHTDHPRRCLQHVLGGQSNTYKLISGMISVKKCTFLNYLSAFPVIPVEGRKHKYILTLYSFFP